MKQGRLFVVSGPSGVGKGTVVSRLREEDPEIRLSISATTREPREGEEDGVSYYFLTNEEFEEKIAAGGFLEHAAVHEHYYGTPKAPVEAALAEGSDIILEIDVQGAMQVKESFENGVYIMILPPSMEELKARIKGRGTEDEHSLSVRLGKAMDEIRYTDRYDYAVVNDDLDSAVKDVRSIISAEHFRVIGAEDIINKYEEENR